MKSILRRIPIMNIETCRRMLLNHYDKLKFEESSDDNRVRLVAKGVHFKSFDDDVRFEFSFNKNGAASVTIIFDSLEPTKYNYDLINAFNDNIGFLKAYLTERNGHHFFAIEHYAYEVVSEENAVSTLVAMIDMILSDRVKEYLLPIVRITE